MIAARSTMLGPFTLSCALHVSVAALAIFLLTTHETVELTPRIVTLLPGPATESPASSESAPRVSVSLPAPSRTAEPLPPPTEERAAVRPSVASAPAKTPKPVNPKPASTMSVSYADFVRQHGVPKAANAPRGVTPRVAESFTWSNSTPTQAGSPIEVGAQDFADGLLRELRDTFARGERFPRGLAADVEFAFRADGSMSGVRIALSSGDKDFDAAVQRAFKNVRAKQFSKSEIGRRFVVRFKVGD